MRSIGTMLKKEYAEVLTGLQAASMQEFEDDDAGDD